MSYLCGPSASPLLHDMEKKLTYSSYEAVGSRLGKVKLLASLKSGQEDSLKCQFGNQPFYGFPRLEGWIKMDLNTCNTEVSNTKGGVLCICYKINTFCYVCRFEKKGSHRPASVCLLLASQLSSSKMALLLTVLHTGTESRILRPFPRFRSPALHIFYNILCL